MASLSSIYPSTSTPSSSLHIHAIILFTKLVQLQLKMGTTPPKAKYEIGEELKVEVQGWKGEQRVEQRQWNAREEKWEYAFTREMEGQESAWIGGREMEEFVKGEKKKDNEREKEKK